MTLVSKLSYKELSKLFYNDKLTINKNCFCSNSILNVKYVVKDLFKDQVSDEIETVPNDYFIAKNILINIKNKQIQIDNTFYNIDVHTNMCEHIISSNNYTKCSCSGIATDDIWCDYNLNNMFFYIYWSNDINDAINILQLIHKHKLNLSIRTI